MLGEASAFNLSGDMDSVEDASAADACKRQASPCGADQEASRQDGRPSKRARLSAQAAQAASQADIIAAGDGADSTAAACTAPASRARPGSKRDSGSKHSGGSAMSAEEDQAWRQRLLRAYAQFEAELGQRGLWQEVDVSCRPGPRALVGRTARVLWSDGVWYLGNVTAYAESTGLHTVSYDDGEVVVGPLAAERVRLLLQPREALPVAQPEELREYAGHLRTLAQQTQVKEEAVALKRKASEVTTLAKVLEAEAAASQQAQQQQAAMGQPAVQVAEQQQEQGSRPGQEPSGDLLQGPKPRHEQQQAVAGQQQQHQEEEGKVSAKPAAAASSEQPAPAPAAQAAPAAATAAAAAVGAAAQAGAAGTCSPGTVHVEDAEAWAALFPASDSTTATAMHARSTTATATSPCTGEGEEVMSPESGAAAAAAEPAPTRPAVHAVSGAAAGSATAGEGAQDGRAGAMSAAEAALASLPMPQQQLEAQQQQQSGQAGANRGQQRGAQQAEQAGEGEAEGAESGPLLPGDVVWCKVTGFPDWPALVITHEQAAENGYRPALAEKNRRRLPLLFFGDYTTSCYAPKDITRFCAGVRAGFHTRKTRKRNHFRCSLSEVETYCLEGELPPGMVPWHGDLEEDEEEEAEEAAAVASSGKAGAKRGTAAGKAKAAGRRASAGSAAATAAAAAEGGALRVNKQLRVLTLGRVEWLHPAFHNEKFIWPVGYRAERLARTPASGGQEVPHLMEVTEAPDGSGPLFRVTPHNGGAVEAPTASKAWALLYASDKSAAARSAGLSGVKMFGISLPAVQRAIERLPDAQRCDRYCGWPDGQQPPAPPELTDKEWRQRLRCEAAMHPLPAGVTAVALQAGQPFVCHVCNEEEELDDNLILQCDCCKVYVHMDCYGVKEAPNGRTWLCDVCSVFGKTAPPPPCALCPIQGGALKRTTCGRWCHVACMTWAEEMRLDPGASCSGLLSGLLSGLGQVHASKFKITCEVCRQPHGACIQCCDPRCYAALHPLCARQAPDCRTEMLEESDCEEDEEGPQADENDAAAENRQQGQGRGKRTRKEGYSTGSHRLFAYCRRHSGLAGQAAGSQARRGRPRKRGTDGSAAAVVGAEQAGGIPAPAEAGAGGPAGCSNTVEAAAMAAGIAAVAGLEQQQQQLLQQQAASDVGHPAVPSSRLEQVFSNPAGSARCVPFDFALRRGQRAPEAVAAAMAKRLFVRPLPYLLSSGPAPHLPAELPQSRCTQQPPSVRAAAVAAAAAALEEWELQLKEDEGGAQAEAGALDAVAEADRAWPEQQQQEEEDAGQDRKPGQQAGQQGDPGQQQAPLLPGRPEAVASQAERFAEMRRTLGQRLTCGKSGIHGWGAFAKQPHRKGDMVIEYVGDLVRPPVADMRERRCYDQVVGAGTYIFRLNIEHCVDATRAGNMAHLLNHSCDPSCISHTITIEGPDGSTENHVVISAKRDIAAWEELTYDYRFSGEEQLPCNCGAATCRGRVNEEPRAEAQVLAPRSKLRPFLPPPARKAPTPAAAVPAETAAAEDEVQEAAQEQAGQQHVTDEMMSAGQQQQQQSSEAAEDMQVDRLPQQQSVAALSQQQG